LGISVSEKNRLLTVSYNNDINIIGILKENYEEL
jgi:putative N-acetylmannosamine-6-phosphate epimerase